MLEKMKQLVNNYLLTNFQTILLENELKTICLYGIDLKLNQDNSETLIEDDGIEVWLDLINLEVSNIVNKEKYIQKFDSLEDLYNEFLFALETEMSVEYIVSNANSFYIKKQLVKINERYK